MKRLMTLALLLSAPAWAMAQDRRAPPPPPEPQVREPEMRLWHEVSVNSSFEFLSDTFVSGSVLYNEAFHDAVAVDAQFGTMISWSPR